MSLDITIDRLVLDGFAPTAQEAGRICDALRAELHRLLVQSTDAQSQGAAVAVVRAPTIAISEGHTPEAIGKNVARSVHTSIGATFPGVLRPASPAPSFDLAPATQGKRP